MSLRFAKEGSGREYLPVLLYNTYWLELTAKAELNYTFSPVLQLLVISLSTRSGDFGCTQCSSGFLGQCSLGSVFSTQASQGIAYFTNMFRLESSDILSQTYLPDDF